MESAAARTLVLLVLSLRVIQAEDGPSPTCSPAEICAVRGSAVAFSCSLPNPDSKQEAFWVAVSQRGSVDLRTAQQLSQRVDYRCSKDNCTLKIQDLREDDSAEYKVQVEGDQSSVSTRAPAVVLSVTDLQVNSSGPGNDGTYVLECLSRGCQPGPRSYIWYRNGNQISGSTSSSHKVDPSYIYSSSSRDSYSCAVRGHEDFPSPSVCVLGQICDMVTYSRSSICAPRGSTLEISARYRSYGEYFFGSKVSTSWFRTERGLQGRRSSLDLKILQSEGRVQISSSTLRIRNLTESDSAEYQFTFQTRYDEWRSVLPGTGVTVTALQVQLIRASDTHVRLRCDSSCSPADRPSYVWFMEGSRTAQTQTSVYEGRLHPGRRVSCALEGYEDHRSPPVYAPEGPSVSVSPSAEVEEDTSVTLSCSSDANPAANYSWFKGNQRLSEGQHLHIRSIQPGDRGFYSCSAANEYGNATSAPRFLDVQYAPKLCSVSVSPSAEAEEDTSVTLSCSCDANPAANYSWFKEGENSPRSSEQNFTITHVRAEDSGTYSCRVWNTRGRLTSGLRLTGVGSSSSAPMSNLITVCVVLLVCLWMRSNSGLG